MNSFSSALLPHPFVIVDLETTGGHIEADRITEIGLIEVHPNGEVERWSSLVQPQRAIPPFITQITGIDEAMVAQAPTFAELAPALWARLQGKWLVAHNARFDYGFLKHAFLREGLRLCLPTLCTVKLSRKLTPEHAKHNLDSLISRMGLQLAHRHRALDDAEVLLVLLQRAHAQDPMRLHQLAHDLTQAMAVPEGAPESLDAIFDGPGTWMHRGPRHWQVEAVDNLRQAVFQAWRKRGPLLDLRWQQALTALGADLQCQRWRELEREQQGELPVTFCLHQEQDWLQLHMQPLAELPLVWPHSYYGVYAQAKEGLQSLKQLLQAQGLCLVQSGLEQDRHAARRGCQGWSDGRCKGACRGKETALSHNQRLRTVLGRLRLPPWPSAQPRLLRERDPFSGAEQVHVFWHWRDLGSHAPEALPQLWQQLQEQAQTSTVPPLQADVLRWLVRNESSLKLEEPPWAAAPAATFALGDASP